MSRIGLVFCGAYAAIIFGCIVLALSAGGDHKGQFVFLQLPIALQGALVQQLGMGSLPAGVSWFWAYVLFGIPTFALLYALGWVISRALRL